MSLNESATQEQLFQKIARRQRARDALRTTVSPGQASLYLIFISFLAATAGFLFERGSMPGSLASVAASVAAAIALIAVEQWRIRRRLEAVIELLSIDDMDIG